MKVSLLDLVKKPKSKAGHNKFEALKEEEADDDALKKKDAVDDEVPAVPPMAFQRTKGKKLSAAYHSSECTQRCCRSASTKPSDFSLCSLELGKCMSPIFLRRSRKRRMISRSGQWTKVRYWTAAISQSQAVDRW